MENDKKHVNFHSGSEISIMSLKAQLESIGVYGIVQNDINSGLLAGFSGGSVRLKVKNEDLEKAQPILDKFLKEN